MKKTEKKKGRPRYLRAAIAAAGIILAAIVILWIALWAPKKKPEETQAEDTSQCPSAAEKQSLMTEKSPETVLNPEITENPETAQETAESENPETETSQGLTAETVQNPETEESTEPSETASAEETETAPSALQPTQNVTEPAEETETREPVIPPETVTPDSTVQEAEVSFGTFSLFSGQFVEDGRDAPMEDVATILVTNHSDRFLDLGMLMFEIDGRPAAFMVTGLPAGRSAWVMEMMGLRADADSKVDFLECIPTFREDADPSPEEISVTAEGNLLRVTNRSEAPMKNVYIYYKNLYPDGNYLGGITYRVETGELEPGASAEVFAGHYSEENSEIVRIEWPDEGE